ncbi:ABC transporter ATP-binding protein [Paenibacillus sp. 32352]|uniref:ABC transporter ATP-binding protein n=1 Tax=Paenibacillus sp. 32352 TaxID=1969111 RepID=UPI0015C49E0F|nr:ABC transporter ATP-binding protein [Paenibacillus sp. 32352]
MSDMQVLLTDNKRRAIRTYLRRQLYSHRWMLALNLGNVVVRSLLFLVPPVMTKYVLEQLLPQMDWNLLLWVSMGIALVPIVGSAMIVLEVFADKALLRLAGLGRADLFNGLQHQPLSWLRRQSHGDLITRSLDDTQSITNFVSGSFLWMCLLTASISAGAAVMLYLYWKLALIILILWIGHAVLVTRIGQHIKQKTADAAKQTSRLTESMREIITGAHFIKSAGIEAKALGTVASCLQEEWSHTNRTMLYEHLAQLFNMFLSSLFLVVMYYGGGRAVIQGEITLGSLVAFIAVYNWIRPFAITLLDTYVIGKKAASAAERVAEIAFSLPEQANTCAAPVSDFSIRAEQLSYSYGERPVLRGISLHIPSGSVVSIAGHRGSGKSTLADLLLGLAEPAAGTLRIGGVLTDELDKDWLLRHLLCVTQDASLRSGTILDNIVYGCENASPDQVQEAVELAELGDWLAVLPDGLNTRVGEQGFSLSGGERQRIGIARALLRKPAILILDESTSALDLGTEQRLLSRLTAALKDSTVIFITHRLSVAKLSDQIIVLQGGALAETGTWDELIERNGTFRKLCRDAE